MKGRIIEIKNGNAVVITQNGEFVKTKLTKSAVIGDEIYVRSNINMYKKSIISAAAMLICICTGVISYCTPASYVDICINPEIQLKINVYKRVIGADAKNDDAKAVLERKNVSNMQLNNALDEIMNNAAELGFIPEDTEKTVVMSVFAKSDSAAQKTYERIKEYTMSENINKVVNLVNEEQLEEAQSENIPIGKYLLINELADITDISKDEIKNYSVKEIINTLSEEKMKISFSDDSTDLKNKKTDSVPTISVKPENTLISDTDILNKNSIPQKNKKVEVESTNSPKFTPIPKQQESKTDRSYIADRKSENLLPIKNRGFSSFDKTYFENEKTEDFVTAEIYDKAKDRDELSECTEEQQQKTIEDLIDKYVQFGEAKHKDINENILSDIPKNTDFEKENNSQAAQNKNDIASDNNDSKNDLDKNLSDNLNDRINQEDLPTALPDAKDKNQHFPSDIRQNGHDNVNIGNDIGKPSEPESKPNNDIGKPSEPESKPNNDIGKPSEPESKLNNDIGKPSEPESKPNNDIGKPSEPESKPNNDIGKPSESESKSNSDKSEFNHVNSFENDRNSSNAALQSNGKNNMVQENNKNNRTPKIDNDFHKDNHSPVSEQKSDTAPKFGDTTRDAPPRNNESKNDNSLRNDGKNTKSGGMSEKGDKPKK